MPTKLGLTLNFANMFVVHATVAFTQSRVMRRLKCHESEIRGPTRKMHSDFIKALIAVAIYPLVATILPMTISLACLALQLHDGMMGPLLTVINTSVALANPITTICFVRPYRATLTNLFQQTRLVERRRYRSSATHIMRGTCKDRIRRAYLTGRINA